MRLPWIVSGPAFSLLALPVARYISGQRDRLEKSGTVTSALLFHELVHAVQFRLLGVETFARLYVRGLLLMGSYNGIPLERCAAELDLRFEIERSPFEVEGEVAEWIERGLL